MEVKKTLRPSKRGLTFTTDVFEIGTHYRYIVDKTKQEVLIIPAEKGNTVSRKQCGNIYKPVIDIRSSEVKELCKEADKLEVIDAGEHIIVRAYKAVKTVSFSKGIVEFEEVIGQEIGTIVLKKAAGAESASHTGMPGKWKAATNGGDSSSPLMPVYDVVSLFSGAGLLDYAFYTDPKFRIAFATDFDGDACKTYRENIGDIMQKDIRDIKAEDVPSGDVVIGGPCCQGFSNANRTNIDSEKSMKKRLLVHEYIRIVQAVSPDVFVVENVPEFLTKDEGAHYKALLEELSSYHINSVKLLDSDIGGYSSRKRLIVVGSTADKPYFPQMKISKSKTCRDALEKVGGDWPNWEDVTVSSPKTQKAMSCVPNGGNWKDIPESVQKFPAVTHSNRYRRLDPDAPCPTITNWRKAILMPYRKEGTDPSLWNRILNISEAAALMGLDKNFRFVGSLNAMQQQVANGVTQAMAQYVKNVVLGLLRKRVPVGHQFTLSEFGLC